ncbi:MAG: alpha-L-fucosidase [Oscillospiraceae bacterium]|nr:alpha-L-fucosidase [Oscillospiraceae bacterium]
MSDTIKEEEIVEEGVHNYSAASRYIRPEEPALLDKLEWFQDQKLALMMHWGPYAQLGIVESWALSDQDADWSRHQIDWTDDIDTFKKQYFALNRTFNPIRFQPEKWADFASENGFRYLIFTTKHHDGFCMWDTAYSDYKITAPDCPFHDNPRADVVGEVFRAFREKGLGIAAYFSKADWYCPWYWNQELMGGKPTWRGPSYDPAKYPELWEQFSQFTRNQITELCEQYGPIDILWLDAGWVRANNNQDFGLTGLLKELRVKQPWLLCADRTVGGPNENYVTPEQCVPDEPLGVPWESCITVGKGFSFGYEDDYKTPRQLVQILVDVVAKGGNLALNVAPQPDGRLPLGAMKSIEGLGSWLKTYGDAIYGTRVCAPYKKDKVAFTRKGETVYAIRLYESENEPVPSELLLPYEGRVESVSLLDSGASLPFTAVPGGISVQLPEQQGSAPIAHVFVLK